MREFEKVGRTSSDGDDGRVRRAADREPGEALEEAVGALVEAGDAAAQRPSERAADEAVGDGRRPEPDGDRGRPVERVDKVGLLHGPLHVQNVSSSVQETKGAREGGRTMKPMTVAATEPNKLAATSAPMSE